MASRSIQERFAEWVAQSPDAIAVASDEVRWTYRELNERADRLARRLLELGAGPERPVAVLMDRSPGLVVATLAVVKTGAYYVPLHSAYPLERLQWIVDRAGGPPLVTDATMTARGLPRGCPVVTVEPGTDPAGAADLAGGVDVESHPDNLAYLMYTSGSTGEPKGVAVTHRDALGLALDRGWDNGAHERALMVAPYAFGMSTYELWAPLLRGGTIVVPPPGDISVAMLRRLIGEQDVTVVHLTAGLFRLIAEDEPEVLRPLREVMTGGDVVPPKAVTRVLETCPDLMVRVMYGQTETTLFATQQPISSPLEVGATVPIGRPMDGMRVYILDDSLRPVLAGATGEMYVAGTGVARGYIDRADLTGERFVPDPFTGVGERMYRTGDLARWTPAGLIDFVGRADDQVKIRGYRVELAEAEAALARYPGLADVAVRAHDVEPGDKRLAAYLVPESGDLDVAAVRRHAVDTLPDYMVPAAYAVLSALPLTVNGKLDRRALPAPDFAGTADYTAPRTPAEETLCAIFAEVLDLPRVGADDSFFDLSGQSMQAIRVTLRIEQDLGPRIDVAELYDNPTPAMLAERLAKAQPA